MPGDPFQIQSLPNAPLLQRAALAAARPFLSWLLQLPSYRALLEQTQLAPRDRPFEMRALDALDITTACSPATAGVDSETRTARDRREPPARRRRRPGARVPRPPHSTRCASPGESSAVADSGARRALLLCRSLPRVGRRLTQSGRTARRARVAQEGRRPDCLSGRARWHTINSPMVRTRIRRGSRRRVAWCSRRARRSSLRSSPAETARGSMRPAGCMPRSAPRCSRVSC